MIKANAQKTLPMLIPALAAVLRPSGGGDVGVCGAGTTVFVGAGVIAGNSFVDDSEVEEEADEAMDEGGDDEKEAEDDDGVSLATTVREGLVDDDEAIAVGLEAPISELVVERPHVFGGTALLVIAKTGELPLPSPDKFSSCIWQRPLLKYSL